MENLYYGITAIILCSGGYFIAWIKFKNNQHNLAVLILIVCGLILRFYVASDLFLHAWDERYHALVAKNLIRHPFEPTLYDDPVLGYDYKNWSGNHIWLHKQPFPLWMMALSMRIFGINAIALRLPSILLSTLGIYLTYRIAKYLYNKKVAFLSAFLFSIHGLIIELTGGRIPTDHYDIFFLFFITLSVFLAIRFTQTRNVLYNILTGISIGLAILSKWLPALIVFPIWLLLLIDSRKFTWKVILYNLLIMSLSTIIISLPWQIYIHLRFPTEAAWESHYNLMHFTEALQGKSEPFYYHFYKMGMIYAEFVYLPVIWFIYKTLKKPKQFKRLLIFVWLIIPYLFFSISRTKMQAYTLFCTPTIFMINGLFWEYLYRYRMKFRFRIIPYIILIGLIALPIRYSIDRMKPFSRRDRRPEWVEKIKELKPIADESNGKLIIFNSDRAIETMFYINCTAYATLPDEKTINNLKSKGYKVMIIHP